MEQVRLDEVGTHHQVAQNPGIIRNLLAGRMIQRQDSGHRMRNGTDSTDPLRDVGRIPRVTTGEQFLESTEERAHHPGLDHSLVGGGPVNSHLHLEVAFDAGDGINGDNRRHNGFQVRISWNGPTGGGREIPDPCNRCTARPPLCTS
jgi:hypothetical protein